MYRAMDIYVEAVTRRNEVLGEGIVDLGWATARSISRLYRAVQTERQRRLWIRKLDRLNDHILRDIGLTRYEIPGYVRRHMAEHGVPSEYPSLVRQAGRAVFAALRSFKVWRDARITARQLGRLDRWQLSDIGIEVSDIGWLSRDLSERSLVTATAANDNWTLPRNLAETSVSVPVGWLALR